VTTAQRPLRVSQVDLPRGSRLFVAAALFALACTFAVPVANAEWSAWRFDHGHATLSGAIPDHTHPWESTSAGPSSDQSNEAERMVYTDGGSGGVLGIGSLWSPSLVVTTPSLIELRTPRFKADVFPGLSIAPSTPPPQA